LFHSIAGQPIIDADEPTHTAAATVYGKGNGKMAVEEWQQNGGNWA